MSGSGLVIDNTVLGFGESEDTGPYGKSQAAVQDLPSEQEDQSSEHDGRRRLRQDTDGSDLPSMPIDPQSVDLSELQKTGVHGRMGGAGKSDTNFQGTPDDSRESSVCDLAFGAPRVS